MKAVFQRMNFDDNLQWKLVFKMKNIQHKLYKFNNGTLWKTTFGINLKFNFINFEDFHLLGCCAV
jgi:hypothetical protein